MSKGSIDTIISDIEISGTSVGQLATILGVERQAIYFHIERSIERNELTETPIINLEFTIKDRKLYAHQEEEENYNWKINDVPNPGYPVIKEIVKRMGRKKFETTPDIQREIFIWNLLLTDEGFNTTEIGEFLNGILNFPKSAINRMIKNQKNLRAPYKLSDGELLVNEFAAFVGWEETSISDNIKRGHLPNDHLKKRESYPLVVSDIDCLKDILYFFGGQFSINHPKLVEAYVMYKQGLPISTISSQFDGISIRTLNSLFKKRDHDRIGYFKRTFGELPNNVDDLLLASEVAARLKFSHGKVQKYLKQGYMSEHSKIVPIFKLNGQYAVPVDLLNLFFNSENRIIRNRDSIDYSTQRLFRVNQALDYWSESGTGPAAITLKKYLRLGKLRNFNASPTYLNGTGRRWTLIAQSEVFRLAA